MANATKKKVSKAKKKTAKKITKKAKTTTRKKTVATAKTKRKTAATVIDPDTRQKMIQEMAYFNAQQRNFSPGNAMDDWLSAESEVDKIISKQ